MKSLQHELSDYCDACVEIVDEAFLANVIHWLEDYFKDDKTNEKKEQFDNSPVEFEVKVFFN